MCDGFKTLIRVHICVHRRLLFCFPLYILYVSLAVSDEYRAMASIHLCDRLYHLWQTRRGKQNIGVSNKYTHMLIAKNWKSGKTREAKVLYGMSSLYYDIFAGRKCQIKAPPAILRWINSAKVDWQSLTMKDLKPIQNAATPIQIQKRDKFQISLAKLAISVTHLGAGQQQPGLCC